MALSTRRNWAPWLDRIQEHFGPLRIAAFDRPAIKPAIKKWRARWRDQPRAFDYAKQVLSAMLSFAVDEGDLDANPCLGMRNAYSVDRSEIIWTPADLALLEKHASPPVWRAARLAALTGLRAGDLLRLPWSRIDALAIEVKTGKGRGRRTALIPLYPELADFLAGLPKVGPIVLVNGDGVPWKSGFTSSWAKTLDRAGLTGLHFHDLRGTAATRMFLGDLSEREIAEIMGWSEDQVARLIARYVKRDELLRDRIRRMTKAADRGDG
jgi:integrase